MINQVLPNNASMPNVKFLAGNTLPMYSQMTRCDYTNTTCYMLRTVATITSIDHASGYATGEQLLTVNGYGLNSANLDVKVDGIPCEV